MRRVLSLLLCVALLCSLVVITAQADAAPQPNIGDVTAVPGATVTINCTLDSNPGLASIRFRIVDEDGLGVTYAGADNEEDTLGITNNDALGAWYWSGSTNNFNLTFGTVDITIPDDAELGDYEFTVYAEEGFDDTPTAVALGSSTFTITVTDKVITGVNVAIDAGLAIGVHVQAADIDGVSITAVDVEGKEYITVDEYEEDEETGDYIFYLNVNPWDMDKEFTVDFTGAFTIANDELDLAKLPATAKTTGILAYCNAVLAGASDELVQLIADLLAYGQAAQTFKGVAVMALPAGLTPTEAAWEDSNGNPCSFGAFCAENFPEDLTGKNATAKKKFKFASATIDFGAKFNVTFTLANNGTTTAFNTAKMKVDGTTYSLSDQYFKYAFSPAQYGGVEFDLYATSVGTTNFCWINNYGPAHYAAYVSDSGAEGSAEILAVLEAFYLYGVSVEAYVATLG